MWWAKSCFLAAGVAVLACSPASPPARALGPAPAPARPAAAAAPWPDVARHARSEMSGAHDGVVVVAVQSRTTLPGVRVSGEDWTRFFPTVLGVPPDRVTALFDASATRQAISSAVRATAARVAPGGRLWFVAIGNVVVSDADIASAVDRPEVQVVSVRDGVPEAAATPHLPARLPRALAPITFSIAPATPLPGGSRSAFSYLLMGALRGWADRDQDGRVTAAEAAVYVGLTLRLLSPRPGARATASVSTELDCSELTTLSVAREPAPNVVEIAPRIPPGLHANPPPLVAALEAVRAASAQLAAARESGSLKGNPELGQQIQKVLASVLEARCGADAAGHQAWQSLLALANAREDRQEAVRLASIDCAYDEASAIAIDSLLRPVHLFDGPNEQARRLYDRAEQENDATLSRCTWAAVAEKYAQSWWSDPEPVAQVEPALNGAYALRRLGRTSDAAALYRAYVKTHAATKAGESASDALTRRSYALLACTSYLAIAKSDPRLFPGYFDTCKSIDCTGVDPATCAKVTAGDVVPLLGSSAPEPEDARRLTLAALEREELAGWEPTEGARADRLREASTLYASAAAKWTALAGLGDAAPDPAEAARRLAEATVRRLLVELEAGIEPTEESLENARRLARRARDLSGDERRVESARLLVELADGLLVRQQRAFAASQGGRGVALRTEVQLEGEGDGRHVVPDELPTTVAAAIAARDELLATVPATFDASKVRYRMAYEAGRLQFLYGHFAEARQRLELPYAMECGVSPVGHEAWVLLLSMANLEGDAKRAASLATDAAVCPYDVETRIAADRMRKPVRSIPFVSEGRRQLQKSEALTDGPQRRALRREAAAIFRHFVDEAPARDEAPEAAWRAAELYSELGETARALEMYRAFIDRYGAEPRVRVTDVERAYAALAMLHAQLGDYHAQARVLVEESEQARLPAKARAAAAKKARELRMDRNGRGLRSGT